MMRRLISVVAFALPLLAGHEASAGDCTITMKFHNAGTAEVELKEISSRINDVAKWTYKKQWDGGTRIQPGADYSMTISVDSQCDKNRDYRVKYYERASGSGFTAKEATKIRSSAVTIEWQL